ncbi:CHAT domain-containing protein [Archangium violaceum]|uniref:CHAT domain-containing protein n=1 Tax=Archangium violaceum TaxID=83451 RepID=UPI00193B5709|nr:CHAT domain-containing protein [Archangium violaceum]QRK11514.1 CHAT domain-containing protein [Archangium violaceum]
MSAPCERIERFADGELAPDEAEAFREHLLDCIRCKVELGNLLQLEMMASRYVEQRPIPLFAPPRRVVSRWRVVALAGAACAALLAVAVFVRSGASWADPWLMREPKRRLEMRLAIAAADHHRPLAARRMGESSQGAQLPLEALAKLERNGDTAGLAAALLARNDKSLVEQALAYLAPLPSTPENETLRATAFLLKGAPEEALRHLDRALDQDPTFPQALWNKALALRELDLLAPSARLFRELAQRGEPGWAEEARQRAEALSAAEQARILRWKAIVSAGQALATDGTPLSSEILAERAPILRLYFYDAVRTRTSREQVLALLPLARELDHQAGGGNVLARYVERIAASDFARRAPLARAYGELRQGTLPPERVQALIAQLLRSPEDDLLLGVLVYARAVGSHLEAFEARAEASQDPWFRLLAAQERAAAQVARGEEEEARQTLLGALALCATTPIEYRCQLIRMELAGIQSKQLRLDEAWTLAEQAWRQARAANNREKEALALGHLAQSARLRNDAPLARACFAELLARFQGNKEYERFAHQSLAHVALTELRFDLARAEFDQAMATGLPLTFVGTLALADLSRQKPAPGDEAALHRAIAEAPASTTEVQRLMLRHSLGRFIIERDRQKGRALLEEVLQGLESGDLLARDTDAQKLRAYTFTSLIFDAGKAGEHGAALELFGREQGSPLPGRCLVAATEDSERSLLIVRGAAGQLLGYHEGARRTRLPENLHGFVPGEALAALQGCEKVEAFVRPPLMDRPGLLPADMAWSYRLRAGPAPSPRVGRSVHLVVKDVALSPERVRALGQLNAWSAVFGPDEERRVLMGTEATPSRVLAAMRDATDIDLVTHGIITSSRFSYLVLAKEGSSDELGAGHIRVQHLEGAPLVVLAACRAARGAYILHEPSGLPAAFIQAGARAVMAATEEIPDLEAAGFFNAVRERIRQGSSPASALRDERRQWLAEGKGRRWLEGVLLYE